MLDPTLKGQVSDGSLLELAAQGNMLLREPGKAAALLEQAIALNPKRAPGYIALGGARIALGERDKGLAMLNKALELEPDSLPAATALARTYLAMGNTDKALATVSKLEQQFPNEVQVQLLRGLTLLVKNDSAGARRQHQGRGHGAHQRCRHRQQYDEARHHRTPTQQNELLLLDVRDGAQPRDSLERCRTQLESVELEQIAEPEPRVAEPAPSRDRPASAERAVAFLVPAAVIVALALEGERSTSWYAASGGLRSGGCSCWASRS